MISLRPRQEECLRLVRVAYRRGRRRVLLVAPTGFGKGTLAAWVLREVASRGGRGLFLVHREEIVRDVAQRLIRAGLHDLAIWVRGELVGSPTAAIHVCSVQTVVSKRLPTPTLIVVDEAHHVVTETHRAITARHPTALVLGLTATPERPDRTTLGDDFDEMVVGPQVAELVVEGWLAPIDVVAPVRVVDGGVAEDPLAAWLAHARGRRTVGFARSVSHAEEMAGRWSAAGYPALSLDGTTPKAVRTSALERLTAGTLVAIFNFQVFTEGVDCPPAEVCLLTRKLSGAGMFLQCVGRVRRPMPGKRAMLLDLAGAVHLWGHPDWDRTYSLHGQAIAAKGQTQAIWTCRECWRVLPTRPPACPMCGAVPPPPPPVEVKGVPLVASPSVASWAERRAYFDELLAAAEERGWKPVAIGIRYKERFGASPPWPIRGRVGEGASP